MKSNKAQTRPVIKAISDGLSDGGCEYTTNFPGYYSHDIFGQLGGNQISLNEKIAFQMAFGASMAGRRSVVSMKSSGLNVALDEYVHGVLNGINAGLVLVLTEDLEGQSSPERQDSRPIIDMYGGLWFEPTSVQNAYELAYKSYDISEELDIPIVIRLTNNNFKQAGNYDRKKKKKLRKPIEKRREKYISHWKSRDDNLAQKNKRIKSFVEMLYPSFEIDQNADATITVGATNEREEQRRNTFQIFTYPLPIEKIKRFIEENRKVDVWENGNNYVYEKILGGIKNEQIISRLVSNKIQKRWKKWDRQEKLFKALQSINPNFVVVDEGTFTDETTDTNNVCLCMGSSVGITMGLAENGVDYPFCVIGDTSFMFGGGQALIEAIHRNSKFCVIVIDNGGALSTGGQKLAGDLEKLSFDLPSKTVDYKDTSVELFEELLETMRKTNKLSIIYVKV